ncbi:MAG: sugar kinase [Aquimonas sp.]|nr:sugar kinase [Aquimonas sp.]
MAQSGDLEEPVLPSAIEGRSGLSVIVCFGEILLRLSSCPPAVLLQDSRLEATVGGAEANVAVALSGFCHDVCMVSVLPDNRLGQAAQGELQRHGVNIRNVQSAPGRMGLYFLNPGAMMRPAEILYDRTGSAFADLDPDQFDWDHILEGVDWLFVGGITAALGDGPLQAMRRAMEIARDRAVRIAFDCNYRPTLWSGRESLAPSILRELSCQADLVFAGRRAIGMMLDMEFDHPDPDIGFAAATAALFRNAPGLRHIAATRREIYSATSHRLTGVIADRQKVVAGASMTLDGIVDRIGTGDAYAAGVLHGLSGAESLESVVAFAGAAAQWSHGVQGDFLRASVADVKSLLIGGADIRR